MAGVQDSHLTIAVSNSGALGSLPCAMLSGEQIVQEITKIKINTNAPFNLNFFCHKQPNQNPAKSTKWQNILRPYYEEYDLKIPEQIKSPTNSRQPFCLDTANILKEYHPNIISFHFGLPDESLVRLVKSWGTTIISSATTINEAIWLEKNGADVIIAQGLEAGGHRGHFLNSDIKEQLPTFDLLPKILQAVSCPVIAAGGIAAPSAIRKALNLGAIGVQIGTAYLLCPETQTKPLHRQAIKDSKRTTCLTNLFSGRLARGINNRLIKELGPINLDAPEFPLATNYLTALRSAAEEQSLDDFTPLWSGENRSACQELPAAEITKILWQDA